MTKANDSSAIDPDDISAEATAALAAAHRQAIEKGFEVVFVSGDQLIRRLPSGERIVMAELPPRQVADVRVKRRTTVSVVSIDQAVDVELKRAKQ